MPNGMSRSDNSIEESLHPPPSQARGRRVAPCRPTQTRRGQNSAGRYPLISRPMQISTRVGVVHAICRPLAFPGGNKVDRDRPPRKHLRKHARSINASGAQRREKTGPLRVRFAVRRRGGRQSPSRGEQLTALRLQSGRMGNRLPPVTTVCRGDFLTQRKGLHASHAAIVRRGGGAVRRVLRVRNASAAPSRPESRGTPARARPS